MEQSEFELLLRRARLRDSAALDELVTLYAPRIFGLLHRLTGSREAAEELLQDTFLRLVRTIDQYEHSGRFDAWLFRIAANLARDRARKRKRRGPQLSLDTRDDTGSLAPGLEPGVTELPSADLERAESGQQLSAALEQLNEIDREIILLRHYADLPFREIAETLGIPLGTALARAHRALKHLRGAMGVEDE